MIKEEIDDSKSSWNSSASHSEMSSSDQLAANTNEATSTAPASQTAIDKDKDRIILDIPELLLFAVVKIVEAFSEDEKVKSITRKVCYPMMLVVAVACFIYKIIHIYRSL
ncbi:hypothetical protein K4I79_004549 [Candida tropicalis]|nr:hypothetical protein [Asgard group archaeon]